MRIMNLKDIRLKRGMTQKELAIAIGVTDAAICQYETGAREPTLDTLRKLSEELNCTLDELIGKEDRNGDDRTAER